MMKQMKGGGLMKMMKRMGALKGGGMGGLGGPPGLR
jgi:signal recognition particle subunit SRP54